MTENQKRRMNDLLEAKRQRELEPDEATPAAATVLTDELIDQLCKPWVGLGGVENQYAFARAIEAEVLAQAGKGAAGIEGLTRYAPRLNEIDQLPWMEATEAGSYVKFADVERFLAQAGVRAEPVARVTRDGICFLRHQPNGEPWPYGTEFYAAPSTPAQVPAAEVRAQALREAAELCDAKFERRAADNLAREASTARSLAAEIRSLAQSSTADKANQGEQA